jgi:IPT/TIG domain/Phosphate-induced protein 1 conserved region
MGGSRRSIGRASATRQRRPRPAGPLRVCRGLGLLVALAALIATFGAVNASAFECYSGDPECPNKGPNQHLVRLSGQVMPTTTTYFVYWHPKGAPAFPAGYKSAITAFFKGLAHDNGTDQNFYSVLTQYGLKYETHFGEAITDKDPYPAETSECAERPSTPCVSLVQIQEELRGLVKAGKLPGQEFAPPAASALPEPTHSYFVLLPPGVSACDANRTEPGGKFHTGIGCSSIKFCGEHEFVLTSEFEAESVVYAVMPYLPGVTGCVTPQHPSGPFDDELTVIEHELAELITNPFGRGWENEPKFHSPEEVADICEGETWSSGNQAFHEKMEWGAPLGTAPNGALYNQVIDGRDYYLQQLYSNETEGCVQRRALPPVVKKLSTVTGPETGGTTVKITGLNFQAPEVTAVKFGNTPAVTFTVTSATSLTAVSPASSPGVVDITLTNAAGQSVAVSADRFTFTPPPTVSSVTPNTGSAAGGTGVTVKGLNFLVGKTTFKFGTAKATSVNCISTTECTMVSPAHTAGTVDVIATVNKLKSPVVTGDKYTYS